MPIIRLIHIKIDPSETETAERIWKTECATLMIAQKGCISEKLLRARDRGEFISYSEWETEADIERYMGSAAHKQIVSHTRGVKGASAVVKLYDLVNQQIQSQYAVGLAISSAKCRASALRKPAPEYLISGCTMTRCCGGRCAFPPMIFSRPP